MRWTSRAVILGSLLFAAAEARAAVWAINGASCTPGALAIQADRYNNPSGGVAYRQSAQNGPTPLYCPITTAPPVCPSAYRLRLTYLDPDGQAGPVSVAARIHRVSQQDGRATIVPGAEIPPNPSNVSVPTSATSPDFVYDFSQLDYYYYVKVDLLRFSGSSLPTFYGVALECAD